MKTSIKTLIDAMRKLAKDIDSADGLANMAIAEAADRLDELDNDLMACKAELAQTLIRLSEVLTQRDDVILAAKRLEGVGGRAATLRGAVVVLLGDPQESELEGMYQALSPYESLSDDEKRKKAALCVLLAHPKEAQ